jgi:CRP/FNR family transcriptional regulator
LTGNPNSNLLRSVPFFSSLSNNELDIVASRSIERQLDAGQIAFLEGDPNAGLYLLVSGRAKISRVSLDGREQVLASLRPGDSCNEVPVIDDGPNPASLSAIEQSLFWIWTGNEMNHLRTELPGLAEAITNSLANRCRELVDKVYRLSFLSVTARLAHFLIHHASQQENQDLDRRHWTQEEIAANIGTVREMVGRSLRSLEKDGLIQVNRHRIEILDKTAMEQIS